MELANLANIAGDYSAAEKHYRRSLELIPDNPAALNELALVLAVKDKDLPEALQLIDRAMAMAGPLPTLLDTRATVYIAQKRYQDAIGDLKEALADGPGPEMQFHLAVAYRARGETQTARRAWEAAKRDGLGPQNLMLPERRQYEEMQGLYSSSPSRKPGT